MSTAGVPGGDGAASEPREALATGAKRLVRPLWTSQEANVQRSWEQLTSLEAQRDAMELALLKAEQAEPVRSRDVRLKS